MKIRPLYDRIVVKRVEEKEQMQSMVLMLTDTLADISGQSDVSVARLQSIEKNLEMASGLNDIRAVRSSLEDCLRSVRDAASQQRSSATATIQRLRDHVETVQQRASFDPRLNPFSEADSGLVPEAKVAVVIGGQASTRQAKQRLGRILRRSGDARAVLYEIVCQDTNEEQRSRKRRRSDAYARVKRKRP